MKYLLFFLVVASFACRTNQQVDSNQTILAQKQEREVVDSIHTPEFTYTNYEQSLLADGFLDVENIKSIQVDLKYATTDNFMEQVLYDSLHHAFLRPMAYEKLEKALNYLQEENSHYTFLVYDGLRPNGVQHKMWELVKNTSQEKYVANPHTGSIHNYGLAIDLTIFDLTTNQPIPMGTHYDFFGRAAEYRYNDLLVNEGVITRQELENRVLLRKVMRKAGFKSIDSEWWHFNALPIAETRLKFTIVP